VQTCDKKFNSRLMRPWELVCLKDSNGVPCWNFRMPLRNNHV